MVTFDQPQTIVQISTKDLDRWGLTHEQAIAAARENLRQASGADLLKGFEQQPGGYYESMWHDGYDAARLLLTEELSQLPFRGDVVAIPVHRDVLLLADSDNVRAQLEMVQRARELLEEPRSISGAALRLVDGQWHSYIPPRGSPLHTSFQELRLLSRQLDYGQQAQALHELLVHRGDRAHIAGYQVGPAAGGAALTSYTVWSKGVPSLLAEADWVSFADPSDPRAMKIYGMAPIGRVRALLAHRMTPLGTYPERYQVSSFPNSKELTRLKLVDREQKPMREPTIVALSPEQIQAVRKWPPNASSPVRGRKMQHEAT